jgi:hypothetical protein
LRVEGEKIVLKSTLPPTQKVFVPAPQPIPGLEPIPAAPGTTPGPGIPGLKPVLAEDLGDGKNPVNQLRKLGPDHYRDTVSVAGVALSSCKLFESS